MVDLTLMWLLIEPFILLLIVQDGILPLQTMLSLVSTLWKWLLKYMQWEEPISNRDGMFWVGFSNVSFLFLEEEII